MQQATLLTKEGVFFVVANNRVMKNKICGSQAQTVQFAFWILQTYWLRKLYTEHHVYQVLSCNSLHAICQHWLQYI